MRPPRGALAVLVLTAATLPARSQELPPLLPEGVDPPVATSIEKGLRYLAHSQSRDGSWRSNGGFGTYPTAMTALAGLALLAAGNTPTQGPYSAQVRRCTEFLLRSARRDGLITRPEDGRSMYGHGFATLYLAEVYGLEDTPEQAKRIHRVLEGAIQLTARSQSAQGGWLYTPDSSGDEGSVTVTQIQALRACRNAGVQVPHKTIDGAIRYIEQSAQADGGIAYRVGQSGSRPAITAAAVATLYNAGEYDSPIATRALEYLDRNVGVGGSSVGGFYFYCHLYMSQAMWQVGGERWDQYWSAMSRSMVQQQGANGSWEGDGVGTVYGTAIACLILQLPYKNLSVLQR